MPTDPLQTLRDGVMPCCGNPVSVQAGPRGGLGRNYRCGYCGAEWNVSPLHAMRIHRVSLNGGSATSFVQE